MEKRLFWKRWFGMVSPSKRSAKKVFKKRGKVIYKRGKPGKAECANCGSRLHGVPRKQGVELAKLSKTEKRPQRPFGGVLCGNCTRRLVKLEARLKHALTDASQADFRLLKYARVKQ